MYSILIENLHFNYPEQDLLFENLTLKLETDLQDKNKLFGIIGPSGSGKTSLMSILGGQLKPQKGRVLINNTDIYNTDDTHRRNLIALQMQTSTSLRGKLKYNLTFGLPNLEKNEHDSLISSLASDNYLIQILKKVGLWNIFKDKQGLDTLIGEGGINLSGGQRQRLNFASLYLRAVYFKPALILIDEPTSSLDEISEIAITDMITELAKHSITLVVAHRLKTVKEAKGLLDFTMLNSNIKFKFLESIQLMQDSKYYYDLVSGLNELDE
jgi:ABC-type multidrug transport system fused ATPase/permease subunit